MLMIPKARLTINSWIAHQPLATRGEDLSPPAFSRMLETDEQVWRREIPIGPDWEPIPLGWLADKPIALITIHNREGRFTQLQPTPEERAAATARIVEVGVVHKDVLVPFSQCRPLESCMFEPLAGRQYFLRCKTDGAKVTVVGVPA
jgi:hypothetical protein